MLLINLSQMETCVKAPRKTQIYLKKHIIAALKKRRKKILIAQNLLFVKIL
jgi:hypothetical protein